MWECESIYNNHDSCHPQATAREMQLEQQNQELLMRVKALTEERNRLEGSHQTVWLQSALDVRALVTLSMI